MKQIKELNLLVDIENLEESLFEIYKQLKPEAEKSKTVIKKLKGGYVNLLYVLYTENEKENGIVFRTYGTKFDDQKIFNAIEELKKKSLVNENSVFESKKYDKNFFFNYLTEASIMNSYSEYNLCRPVHAKYLNGLCYSFTCGVTLNGPLMLTNDFLKEMSSKLAKFHSIKIDKFNETYKTYYDKTNKIFSSLMKPLNDYVTTKIEKVNEYPYNEFPSQNQLLLELNYLKSKLKNIGFGEIAFCHNDLNQKNIIWNPQERNLKFIDFELAMNNYIAYEIAFLFNAFCDEFLKDHVEEMIPNNNYRLNFIRNYLMKKYELENSKLEKENFENDVKLLFFRSNIFLLFLNLKNVFMAPFYDFKPEVFKVEEKSEKYSFGIYGFKIWNHFLKNKDTFLNPIDDYLSEIETLIKQK